MKNVWHAMGIAAGTAIVSKLFEKTAERVMEPAMLRSAWQSFVVELWPVWLGLIVGGLYWILCDYVSMRRRLATLESEPASRSAADTQLSERIAKLESKAQNVQP